MQTKGFVVLSGISGTGKSKIAQTFVEMMPVNRYDSSDLRRMDGVLPITLSEEHVRDRVIRLPDVPIDFFPPVPIGSNTIEIEIGGRITQGRFGRFKVGPKTDVRIFCKDIRLFRAGQRIFLKPLLDRTTSDVTRIRFLTYEQLPPMVEKDHGTGHNNSMNHLFLSVRPDWRDSTSLLGYFNPLTQTYEWTDFLRFILRAAESYRAKDGFAWFVILDEMNLAHVEYYFADLLSVIESGRRTDPADTLAGFTREPLRTTYPDTLDDEVPPRAIFLPPNLYIIGTVNMDETTHAFSPKVLDRAFTIELTDVSFRDYPPVTATNGAALGDSDKRALLAAFTRDGRFHGIHKEEVAQAVVGHPEIRDWLGSLNHLLMRDRFHFGYRIFDEICQYVVNNDLNGMMAFDDAFDQAVFMKVLPKFSGSRARLRNPLISVLAWAIDPAQPLPKEVVTDLDTHLAGTSEALSERVKAAEVSTVANRALAMLERVELDGFVSFG